MILDHIFDPEWGSPKDLIGTLPEIRYDTKQLSETHNADINALKVLLDFNASVTIRMFEQEAASYPSLSIICVHFVSVLKSEFQDAYKYSNQHSVALTGKPGPSPSTDSSVILVSHERPRFLFELKASVQHTIMQLTDKDVIEVLLQGYYCIRHNKLKKLVICLTDLVEWHYMLIEASNEKIALIGYKYICGMSPSRKYSKCDLQEHTKFIIEMERELRV